MFNGTFLLHNDFVTARHFIQPHLLLLYFRFGVKTYIRIRVVRSLRIKHTSSHNLFRISYIQNLKLKRFIGCLKTKESVNHSISFYWATIVVFVISTTKPVSEFLVLRPNDYISSHDVTTYYASC